MHEPRNGFSAQEIALACGGSIRCGDPSVRASGVCTDTRELHPEQAFFALVGAEHDGHGFLPAAEAAGARICVVERMPEDWAPADGTAVVQVEDTTRALLALAAWHRARLNAQVVAVTGSYGKSTVKEMLGAILGRVGRCTVAPASFNNRIGVARSLLAAAVDDDYVVLEMGTNHPGEIDELARAARPDLGVVTAIGEVHLEGLGSLEGVLEAKAELMPHIAPRGALVLNADNAPCASLAGRFGGKVLTFGLSAGTDVRPECIHASGRGWAFSALGWVFELPQGPRHNVLNAAAALCAASALGVSPRDMVAALAEFRAPHMRYERLTLGGVSFICDCYNSNPPALRAALESFMLERNAGRKVVVCGDMLELGEQGPRLHREIGRELAAAGIDLFVAVGEQALHFIEGWHMRAVPAQTALYFRTAREAWAPLHHELRPGDAVLLKGSRAMRLETITESIAACLAADGKEAA